MLYNLTLTELQTHILKIAVEAHIDALHTEMYDFSNVDSLDEIREQLTESHKLLEDLKTSKGNPIDLDDWCEDEYDILKKAYESSQTFLKLQGEDEMNPLPEDQYIKVEL